MRTLRRLVGLALAFSAFFWGRERHAHALDPEITSDTSAQFYEVRSPTGETSFPRKRGSSVINALTNTTTLDPRVRGDDELSLIAAFERNAAPAATQRITQPAIASHAA